MVKFRLDIRHFFRKASQAKKAIPASKSSSSVVMEPEVAEVIFLLIFSHLSLYDRLRFRRVCKEWRRIMPFRDAVLRLPHNGIAVDKLAWFTCLKHLEAASLIFPRGCHESSANQILQMLDTLMFTQCNKLNASIVLSLDSTRLRRVELSTEYSAPSPEDCEKFCESCPNVQILKLRSFWFADAGPFAKLTKLVSLAIVENKLLESDEGLSIVCQNHGETISLLDVSGCNKLTSFGFLRYLIAPRELRLVACPVSLEDLQLLPEGELHALAKIDISRTELLTDDTIHFLFERNYPVTELTARGSGARKGRITAAALGKLIRQCPDITVINVTCNPDVDDELFDVVTEACQRIKCLEIRNTGCTDEGFMDFLAKRQDQIVKAAESGLSIPVLNMGHTFGLHHGSSELTEAKINCTRLISAAM